MASNELLQALTETTLAGSAAILLVLVLRRPLRRAFGAGVAYAVWILVPLAMLAMLLPAPPEDASASPVVVAMRMPARLLAGGPVQVATPGATDWLMPAWLLGAVATGLWLWHSQRAFCSRLGPLLPHGGVLRAQGASAGLPATFGLLRPRIVLPADFETRFDAAQRELVLAHERRHIARRDPWANALAALLRCLFWFNPLVHAAVACLRHDQELACDADVLAGQPQRRRQYGHALLNTQLAAQMAPLGCHFGFGHPLKERIAMLGNTQTSQATRMSGAIMVALLGLGTACAAWAAQPQAASSAPPVPAGAGSQASQPGSVIDESRMLNPPVYPAEAAQQGKVGTTVLIVDIDAKGHVTGVTVERSAGDASLDSAAMQAAAKWTFQPAIKGGKPVAAQVRVPVQFAMDAPAEQAG